MLPRCRQSDAPKKTAHFGARCLMQITSSQHYTYLIVTHTILHSQFKNKNKNVQKMSSFLKVQVTLLLIYSSVSPVIGISNIFKSFPIFGWALDNNNATSSVQGANTTSRSGNETDTTYLMVASSVLWWFNSWTDDTETCIPPLLLNGLIDPLKREYKAKDVIRVTCKDGFELEDQSSTVLYCSPQGLWQVFTFDNDGSIPLPRCIGNKV